MVVLLLELIRSGCCFLHHMEQNISTDNNKNNNNYSYLPSRSSQLLLFTFTFIFLFLLSKKNIKMIRTCSAFTRFGFSQQRAHTLSRTFSTNAERFSQFYRVSDYNSSETSRPVTGEVLDKSIDLTKLRPGDKIDLPYELTVNQSVRDFWQSAFYSHDRINTSTPYARNLGFQDQVIPFSLMLFLAGSMSHADHAKLQIGFGVGVYHWPAFAGDTFRKRFIIKSLRPTSDGQNSILKVGCEIHNQRDMKLFSCEKYVSILHIF